MITNLKIKNFQSHKNTEISFDPGVNVILGSSDSGKSSVLRALLWVIRNRPTGDGVRNWDSKKSDNVDVTIETSDGHCITKQRSDGKAVYILNGSKFEAFKQDVPSEIEAAFNISEINAQTQHEDYFLLKDSPGEVARKLNEFTGLDIIDRLFKFINSKALRSKQDAEESSRKVETLTTSINNLSYIDEAEADLNSFERDSKSFDEQTEKFENVRSVLNTIEFLNEKLEEHYKIINLSSSMEQIFDLVAQYNRDKTTLASMKAVVDSLKEVEERLVSEREWLEVETDYTNLKQLLDKYQSSRNDFLVVDPLITRIEEVDKQISRIKLDQSEKQNKFDDLMRKNKVCPLCGKKS